MGDICPKCRCNRRQDPLLEAGKHHCSVCVALIEPDEPAPLRTTHDCPRCLHDVPSGPSPSSWLCTGGHDSLCEGHHVKHLHAICANCNREEIYVDSRGSR